MLLDGLDRARSFAQRQAGRGWADCGDGDCLADLSQVAPASRQCSGGVGREALRKRGQLPLPYRNPVEYLPNPPTFHPPHSAPLTYGLESIQTPAKLLKPRAREP